MANIEACASMVQQAGTITCLPWVGAWMIHSIIANHLPELDIFVCLSVPLDWVISFDQDSHMQENFE
jgi:hypothetical protein